MRIKVVGVGDGGCNTVRFMAEQEKQPEYVVYLCLNTDAQGMESCPAHGTILLGTTGMGAGGRPDVGHKMAEMSQVQIREALEGCNILFIVASLGGGTGSGATPLIASMACEMGIPNFAIVTRPFQWEGDRRKTNADRALRELQGGVNGIVVMACDRLQERLDEGATTGDVWNMIHSVVFEIVSRLAHGPLALASTHDDINKLPDVPPQTTNSNSNQEVARALVIEAIAKARLGK